MAWSWPTDSLSLPTPPSSGVVSRPTNRARQAAGLPAVPLDERLLAALAHGLPDCAGVALGFDRLLMLAAGATDIGAVQAFSD